MADRTAVACVLRAGCRVLVGRRRDDVPDFPDRWDVVSAPVSEPSVQTAASALDAATGLGDAASHRRTAAPIQIEAADEGERWAIHPFLFEHDAPVDPPSVPATETVAEWRWTDPAALFADETVPWFREAYTAVAPTLETIRQDTSHGAAQLSIDALTVLRDRAAAVAAAGGDWQAVAASAAGLREARAAMGVVRTRIDRVMATTDRTPRAVHEAARSACGRAVRADVEAGRAAARLIEQADGVLTLSRSGTVRTAILAAAPAAVYVAESRPQREGVGVAESLAAALSADSSVTLCVDAAMGHVLASEPIDVVLVGADTVRGDGHVGNKVGTRLAALAAAANDIECHVVCARDKIVRGDAIASEPGPPDAVYDGDAPIAAVNPTFESIPVDYFDAIVTEDGILDPDAVGRVADEHAGFADWLDNVGDGSTAGDGGA